MLKRTAQVLSIEHRWFYQRKKCDIDSSAIWRASEKFYWGSFWARGYFVSTVGLEEEMVRAYIRHQEKEDDHYDQMKLGV